MHRMIWAALAAFAVTLAIGGPVIGLLLRLKVGQQVYALAPEAHQQKQGTPTMGGLMFAAVSIVVLLIVRRWQALYITDLVVCLFALLNLAIGFMDDLTKIRGKQNQGLTERQKLLAQGLLALLFSLYCYYHVEIGPTVIVPFFGVSWDLGPFYIPVMVFVIICTTNGANLLDGLDGLLGGVTGVIAGFFAVAALLLSAMVTDVSGMLNVGVLCAALGGALLGYLRFNLHPAQLMMGDTGSMYLGGLVVAVAMVTRLPLIIPLAAGMYAVSLLSVFIQRWYFRFTKGKRVFKNSPYHHHLEMSGMKETKIVSMYVIITVMLCLLAMVSLF